LFVDPKGTAFASYQQKVDGFNRIFDGRTFNHDGLKVSVQLMLFTDSIASIGDGYRKYCFDNMNMMGKKMMDYFSNM